jgi:hypothetical protein
VGIVNHADLDLASVPAKSCLAFWAPHLITSVDFSNRACAFWAGFCVPRQELDSFHCPLVAFVTFALLFVAILAVLFLTVTALHAFAHDHAITMAFFDGLIAYN